MDQAPQVAAGCPALTLNAPMEKLRMVASCRSRCWRLIAPEA